MKRVFAAALLTATFAVPAIAADQKQELTITRGSTTDQISGLVVQGNSVVLVYGAPGMGANNQAVRITPEGRHLRVVYDTVSNLRVNTAGLRPAMMMTRGGSGGEFPIYNDSQGGN